MKHTLKNKFFLLLISIGCFALAYYISHCGVFNKQDDVGNFKRILHRKELKLKEEIKNLILKTNTNKKDSFYSSYPNSIKTFLRNEGFGLFILEKNKPIFWTTNTISIEDITARQLQNKIIKTKNGWYEIINQSIKGTDRLIVGMLLIKNEYPYQNRYLTNSFQKHFNISPETKIVIDETSTYEKIYDHSGVYLFSLAFPAEVSTSLTDTLLTCLFYLIGFALLLSFIRKEFDILSKKINPFIAYTVFILLVIVIRYVTIAWHFPHAWYASSLFQPKYFADATSVWLPSLGDLFINSLLMLYCSYFIYKRVPSAVNMSKWNRRKKIIFAFAGILFLSWMSTVINYLFTGLIRNSSISFNVNNLFGLTLYSYVGFIIVGFLLFAFFLFSETFISLVKKMPISSNKTTMYVLLFCGSIHTVIYHFLGSRDLVFMLWPYVILATILIVKKESHASYPFSTIMFLVFAFSLYSVHIFLKHTRLKENETRKAFAEKLAAERDPIAEHIFNDTEDKIFNDTILTRNYRQLNFDAVEKRLRQQYFSGYWEKYDIKIALFDSACNPLIKPPTPNADNTSYYDNLIKTKGEESISEHFFHIPNPSGKINYLACFPLLKKGSDIPVPKIYIELESKFISEELGFPELLLDRSVISNDDLSDYSYAKYKNGTLVNHYGNYPYSLNAEIFHPRENKNKFIDINGYNHLFDSPDKSTLVILSRKARTIMDEVTTFSYLFAFFSTLLITLLFAKQLSLGAKFGIRASYKYRIQLFLILMVFLSLLLLGAGSIYSSNQHYEQEIRENISEKMNSILVEVQDKLAGEDKLDSNFKEYASYILKKLSNIFYTDIHLYDLQGDLLASSRQKLFEEGISSKKMNPKAYSEVALHQASEFIHNESIGKLRYVSAYSPFRNKEGKILAYLNIPYFAKQSELEKAISESLVALINVFVLLFAISIVIAVFLSNYLTRPLKIIQKKMSHIKLGKANELIEWKQQDEIGSLVSEYNRMIIELAHSAELLAKSERESAWREMAKQVAHEIKNPLTPMKLNIQHLKKIWNDKSPDMGEKMERISATLIEQIDILSSIATEFSSFAKMPKASQEKINVKNILINVIDLYKDSIKINCIAPQEELFIMADKEQMLRVFNNLIKNALQSIPESREGIIDVEIKKEEKNILLSIKDNGIGISEETEGKIFTPNFTTKTGGMGLGLAMVKNIIESSGGKIWFKTKVGEGTTFFMQLPEAMQ